MKRGVTVRGLASAITLSALSLAPIVLWSLGVQPPGIARAAVPPPSIALIQSMSDLATTRVHISDVIEGENGHYQGRWTLHGEAVLGVDLSKVSYLRLDAAKKEAVLTLPPPHLIASKVIHEHSDEQFVKAVAWIPLSSAKILRDEVWKQADRKIQRLGQESGHMERARVQAERVLHKLFSGVGWEVRFEWEDDAKSIPPPSREADAGPPRPTTGGV